MMGGMGGYGMMGQMANQMGMMGSSPQQPYGSGNSYGSGMTPPLEAAMSSPYQSQQMGMGMGMAAMMGMANRGNIGSPDRSNRWNASGHGGGGPSGMGLSERVMFGNNAGRNNEFNSAGN